MAEAHPVGFRWVMKARERGAVIINVDPHYARTSALSDIHVPIRAGSDIAFLGGLIRHIIETKSYFEEYVVNYTNAATIINEDFRDTEDLGGYFSGFDPETGIYDRDSWRYEGEEGAAEAGGREHSTQAFSDRTGAGMETEGLRSDPTLQHPRCVFQILRRHYARYTPEMVERVCGIPPELFLKVADTLIANSGRERTTMLTYAVGWTQHSTGVQTIRAGAIVQLLLGNIGRPGGGIMAMRGHATIQGSSDIPTLYDLLPGYLPMPRAREGHLTLEDYCTTGGSRRGWWSHFDVYAISLLKAWFGDAAAAENDYGFAHLPKISGNHSQFPTMLRMLDGGVDGMFVLRPEPRRRDAALRPHAPRAGEARSGSWCATSPTSRPPASGRTRPRCARASCARRTSPPRSSSCPRAATWRRRAPSRTPSASCSGATRRSTRPATRARSCTSCYHLSAASRPTTRARTTPRDWPIRNLTWDYPVHGRTPSPSAEAVLKEINGFESPPGGRCATSRSCATDGSTACGCWIYAGVYADGVNQARRREPGDVDDPEGGDVSPEWGWAWPANRRILYNRASADPQGGRGRSARSTSGGTRSRAEWTGYDVPDFPRRQAARLRAAARRQGHGRDLRHRPVHHDGRRPRLAVLADGSARRAAAHPLRADRVAGRNPLYPEVGRQPGGDHLEAPGEPAQPDGERRLPDHRLDVPAHRAPHDGPMSRNLPWLAELQPELFAEIDPVLAADRGIEDGGWMVDLDRARRGRGAGQRHAARAARCASTGASCTRSPSRGTGGRTRPRSRASRATRSTT